MIRSVKRPDDCTGPVEIDPTGFSVIYLAELVSRLVGGLSEVIYMPFPQDESRQKRPDISLAKFDHDLQPLVGLEDGLKETVNYVSRRLQS